MTFTASAGSARVTPGDSPAGGGVEGIPGNRPHRSGVCMASLDPSLVIQQTNREFSRQFGTPSAELCGVDFRDLVHPSVKLPLMRQFSRLIEGRRQLFDTHVVAVRPEESAFVGSLTAAAVSGESPQVSAVLIFMRGSEETEETDVLPPRKKLMSDIDAQILEGIAAGLSTIHLASRLYLSRQGVEYHVTGLLRKLRVPNRAALVSRAYSMGVLNVGTWPPKVVRDFVK